MLFLKFSYTISKRYTHALYVGICIFKTHLLNGRVCFNVEETTLKRDYYKRKIFIRSILFLKIAPMIIENNFKGHSIEKLPKLTPPICQYFRIVKL